MMRKRRPLDHFPFAPLLAPLAAAFLAAAGCGDSEAPAVPGEARELSCAPGASCLDPPRRAACGNNVLEDAEQCDDDNGTPANLDGCDASCRYEFIMRMNSAAISRSPAPSGCTPTTNILGRTVVSQTAVGKLNSEVAKVINDGTLNVLVQSLGLDDLTGVSDPSVEFGMMSAVLDPARGAWPGNNPIDWWFLVKQSDVDADGLPRVRVKGAISANKVTAGPTDVLMPLSLGGSVADLKVRDARFYATNDSSPAPDRPAPPPSLMASGLSVLRSVSANAAGQGFCGNITVESLAQLPLPEALTTGATACSSSCPGSRAYKFCGADQPVGPGCNSLLDAVIGGCRVTVFCIAALNSTQPDVAGAGFQGQLTLGAGNKVPDNQWKGNDRAYSAHATFTSNRAHATGVTSQQSNAGLLGEPVLE